MNRVESTFPGYSPAVEPALQDLEIVVVFTTPDLTKAGLREAERLGSGLRAHVRLIRVQVVPYPLDLRRPPVSLSTLRKQLRGLSMACSLPVTAELHLARDLGPALLTALKSATTTVIASKRRPWRTRQEQLATRLQRAGHQVLICYPEVRHA